MTAAGAAGVSLSEASRDPRPARLEAESNTGLEIVRTVGRFGALEISLRRGEVAVARPNFRLIRNGIGDAGHRLIGEHDLVCRSSRVFDRLVADFDRLLVEFSGMPRPAEAGP